MENEVLNKFKDDFALLIEAGFVAVKQLDEIGARRIFQAAQMLHPDSSAPQIGFGYIALNKLEIKEATEIFTEITKKEPDNQLASMFLGISYLLDAKRRNEGEKIIQDILKKADEPTIVQLGKLALEWSEKELKKQKTSLFST